MINHENHCVGCEGIYRQCNNCRLTDVKVYYCDVCGQDIEDNDIYKVEDYHYCRDCLLETFKHDPEEDD